MAAMVQRGIAAAEDFDPRVVSTLASLHNLAAVAVDRLANSDLTGIRSKAGFFMGADTINCFVFTRCATPL